MKARVAILAVLISLGLGGNPQAAEPRWEVAADLGGAHTLGTNPIFDSVMCGGGSLLVRLRQRWNVGVFIEYRHVLDPEPASSFWYADIGVRGRLILTQRLWLRLDLGWSFRHIGIGDGYSNTVGGLMAGSGLGMTLYTRRNWNLSLAAVYHITARLPSEPFATQDLGLTAVWAWKW
jgi:hypothetical protein